jgi:hypothetical protein
VLHLKRNLAASLFVSFHDVSLTKQNKTKQNKTNRFEVLFIRKNLTALHQMSTTFSLRYTCCVPTFCYRSVYCCLIRYVLVRIRIAKCFTISRKWFPREVMFGNKHILLMNTRCLHLRSSCASGLSSDLATKETLTLLLQRSFRDFATRVWTSF